MAPRRSVPPSSSLSPQDPGTPSGGPIPATHGFPRSTSPSGGFLNSLTRPSKWFGRSASNPKMSSTGSAEPRTSSSSGRKHKISRPTDPRPILDSYGSSSATRSVLDLSARPPASLDLSSPFNAPPSQPSSPSTLHASGGLGDLRSISKRAWSRSADDLSKLDTSNLPGSRPSFEDKVAIYRGRSNSNSSGLSPTTPLSAPVLPGGVQPFPTFKSTTTTPSTSPPKMSNMPAVVSISVSAPAVDEASTSSRNSPPSNHVHTRSHSFTPKLSSKLSAPRFPSSPKRKGSAGSEMEGQLSAPPIRTTFFSSNNKEPSSSKATSQSSHRSTALLAPPVIVEPEDDSSGTNSVSEAKRSSQIVYNSGFLNRLSDVPANLQHANLSNSKGWKPFKVELKGSKLYFYKPPGDRSAGVKELFPVELVPPSQDDDEGEEGEEEKEKDESYGSLGEGARLRMGGRKDDSLAMRKRRAFWGRRTHPDLMRDPTGKIEKGTFEALTHEAVFGTTFLGEDISEVAYEQDEQSVREVGVEKWKDFASAILLCMPYLVDHAKFEGEFKRCCEYLVSGAEEEKKKSEQGRVAWLAGEYLRYHGRPIDFPDWEDWRIEAIPSATSALVPPTPQPTLPMSTSTQALFNPTPNASPDLGAFSPRPQEDSKLASLMGTLGPHDTSGSPSMKGYLDPKAAESQGGLLAPFASTSNPTPPWAIALDREGLSRNVLLSIDPQIIAQSLSRFHCSVLHKVPDNLTAEFVLGSSMNSGETLGTSHFPSTAPPAFAALFGSGDRPHWLTKLVLMQVLVNDTSTPSYPISNPKPQVASPGRRSEDRGTQTSRTHSRSEVISAWVRIGEYCRVNGDECSWRAIMHGVCSPPVARMEKAWKRVEPAAVATVESWTQIAGDGESVGIKEPRLTPWGGDIRKVIHDELAKASGKTGEIFSVESIVKAQSLFERFRTSFSLCPRKVSLSDDDVGDDVRKLVEYWSDLFADAGNSGLAAKFQRIDQFMSLSLAAEPRRKGLYEPFFWSKSSSNPQSSSSLIPLLFPEPLPTVTLIDRSQLLRGRVDSDATDIQHLRAVDGHLRPDDRPASQQRSESSSSPFSVLSRGGTVIPVFNGELLLVVQNSVVDSAPNSRPSSLVRSRPPSGNFDIPGTPEKHVVGRAPSIRVKPGSSRGLDRKSSLARRNSLPSLSQRQPIVVSETSADPPLRVLVQSGTLDRLVDILVHGLNNVSVSVADDNGEMSLREGSRELMLDHKEFSRVWWNVFRSFVTPIIFFELLRKSYIRAQPQGSEPTVDDYVDVLTSREKVIETIKTWLTRGSGAQDMLDDSQLLLSLRSFLQSPTDHLIYMSSNFDDLAVQQAKESLVDARTALERLIHSQILRPHQSRIQPLVRQAFASNESRVRNLSTREPPDMDRMSPEEFVDNLDGMAFAAFNNVTEEDLYITADLLETQSADRIGWFLPREPPSVEEIVEIQTIHSYLQEVEPSSLISELSPECLYRLLPPGIRSCIRAFYILRKWIISKIVAPRLGLRARQARMESLVQALEVTRMRSLEYQNGRLDEQPCVRSFTEAVISSAIISTESRMHQRAWQNVALNRGCQCDSLASLLSRPTVRSISSKEPLTVDMGWLIERMLDVVAMPDTLEPIHQEGQNLVNFDKRRHLCNFISNAPSLMSRRFVQQNDINRRGFERLNNIEREVFSLHFDLRSIKDEAHRESSSASTNGSVSAKKPVRPFHRLVTTQLEKNRRDKSLRARLQKEKLQEQSRQEKREELINKAMRGRRNSAVAQKQHRNKKSMSALFHFIRPISSAFGADTPHPPVLKRTVSELDFAPSGKPTLVLSLMDSRVAQFINNVRSFTFQLDTEDGGHYLLQALNKRDMNKWIETITRISNIATKRRLTYLGSPKPQVADHIQTQPSTATRDPRAVFGVELNFLLEREAGGGPVFPGTIPTVMQRCLAEVESRGLSEVGIYRMAGASSEIAALKDAFNQGEYPIVRTTDIHAICDLIKTWFRVLPEPIFPASSYHDVIAVMKLESLDERIANIRNIVHTLPQANFDLLKKISEHLDTVTDYEEHNQMTAEALSIVFSPNLLRAPQNDFLMVLANMAHSHKLVKTLITHFHVIFDDTDPEAEGDQDDELDTPIAEEDEREDDRFSIPLTEEPESSQIHLDLGHDASPFT
ncbi:rho gtpase activating protein 22 [Moniliophthora roreri MCA 2997]|uniref:Rho gtpase activating protein 22 n=1 Tax=Moniliophthora roreri (strain MCA 2997) TaxID=1381753 RepID=V2YIA7_MONRO|nr:rho gtpase activating protein 22 [Moniliophthora roreri MCA 2997]